MRGRAAAAALALALVLPAPPAVVAAPRPPAIPGAPVTAAPLPPPPGHTELVSQRRGGGFPAGSSAEPSISANGRYVAFTSAAPDIVGGPAGAQQALPWVFVRDRDRDRTTRLPLPAAFGGGGSSRDPSISADGSVVAFTYQPAAESVGTTAVVPGTIVLAWDRRSGGTWRWCHATSREPRPRAAVSLPCRGTAATSPSRPRMPCVVGGRRPEKTSRRTCSATTERRRGRRG